MLLTSADIPAVTGIYKITCKINSKSYVGQARNIKARIKQHLRSSISPAAKDYGVPFHAAIRKYGIENFDITVLEICEADELNAKERFWIKTLRTYIHFEDSVGYWLFHFCFPTFRWLLCIYEGLPQGKRTALGRPCVSSLNAMGTTG
jgi:hypothetical protein